MDATNHRAKLLMSFGALQINFNSSLQATQKKAGEFEVLRELFISRISEILETAHKSLSSSNPIKPQIEGFIKGMEMTKIEWDTKVAGREKGVAFRKGFEDSLLTFVCGKVKSGKSSLGNYMAWGNTDPTELMKRRASPELRPRYSSHDRTNVQGGDTMNEAQEQHEFRVGATEATSSIQCFSLPGLTWVDSPGLHSVNAENETLAKEYVEHADLILYTMKSDSPGRGTDLAEITQLLGKDKKVLLLLTGSDDVEEDFDVGSDALVTTVVMKDQLRRAKQREYVRTALEKTFGTDGVKNVDIVSFSARYAQLHANDAQAFQDSGMGQLCETLDRICQSEGIRIKQRTPIVNLSKFLQSCIADLGPYQLLIKGFKQPLEDLKRRSNKSLNAYIRQGQSDLEEFIDNFFQHLEAKRADAGEVSRVLTEFNKPLSKHFQKVAEEQLGIIFEEIMNGFGAAVRDTYSSSQLVQCLPDFHIETIVEQIPLVEKGSRKRNSLLGAIAGGALGFAVGGPAGAALGASLGGGLGGATGKDASTGYREITVTVGDNLQDIRARAIQDSQEALERQMRTSTDRLWQSMDRDVEQLLNKLSGEMGHFKSQLQTLLQTTITI